MDRTKENMAWIMDKAMDVQADDEEDEKLDDGIRRAMVAEEKGLRILVTGQRTYNDTKKIINILTAIHRKHVIEEIIEGGALGADKIAAEWGHRRNIKVTRVRADWKKYGMGAGHVRNGIMIAMKPDRVIAFFSEPKKSKGAKDCVSKAQAAGIPTTAYGLQARGINLPVQKMLF